MKHTKKGEKIPWTAQKSKTKAEVLEDKKKTDQQR